MKPYKHATCMKYDSFFLSSVSPEPEVETGTLNIRAESNDHATHVK